MDTDITTKAVEFVSGVASAVLEAKPEATSHEIIGVVYQILNNTIERLKNEQLPESREVTSGEGAIAQSEQVQGIGSARRTEKSPQGVRSQQSGTTRSGAKKRRSKKTA